MIASVREVIPIKRYLLIEIWFLTSYFCQTTKSSPIPHLKASVHVGVIDGMSVSFNPIIIFSDCPDRYAFCIETSARTIFVLLKMVAGGQIVLRAPHSTDDEDEVVRYQNTPPSFCENQHLFLKNKPFLKFVASINFLGSLLVYFKGN